MRSTETRLRLAFADVLTALLATAAGAVVITGCSGGTAGTPTGLGSSGGSSGSSGASSGGSSSGNTPGFTSMCNKPELQTSLLQGLTANPAIDGAMSRTETAYLVNNSGQGGAPDNDTTDNWQASTNETVGALCNTASDRQKCLTKVQGFRILPSTFDACKTQYPNQNYGTSACSASYILYTRGDEIGVARTKDETTALIGTFDTFAEASWVVQSSGLSTACGMTGLADSEYRTTSDGGWDFKLYDYKNCGQDTFAVLAHVDYAGKLTEVSRVATGVAGQCVQAGRRPEGLVPRGVASGNAVGDHFAAMATLEAASVISFRRLHRQLAGYGAPAELLARIKKAAKDEIRHARTTGALARKYGVTPCAPELAAHDPSPSLFAIALENAREGCVRETYGALVAHLQKTRAGDEDVRTAMSTIADEETEHAALSWDIAAWIESRLSDEERATLAAERGEAFATLARELAAPVDADIARASGVPASVEAVRMLEGLAPLMLAA